MGEEEDDGRADSPIPLALATWTSEEENDVARGGTEAAWCWDVFDDTADFVGSVELSEEEEDGSGEETEADDEKDDEEGGGVGGSKEGGEANESQAAEEEEETVGEGEVGESINGDEFVKVKEDIAEGVPSWFMKFNFLIIESEIDEKELEAEREGDGSAARGSRGDVCFDINRRPSFFLGMYTHSPPIRKHREHTGCLRSQHWCDFLHVTQEPYETSSKLQMENRNGFIEGLGGRF